MSKTRGQNEEIINAMKQQGNDWLFTGKKHSTQ
jgi:hypothetical protein